MLEPWSVLRYQWVVNKMCLETVRKYTFWLLYPLDSLRENHPIDTSKNVLNTHIRHKTLWVTCDPAYTHVPPLPNDDPRLCFVLDQDWKCLCVYSSFLVTHDPHFFLDRDDTFRWNFVPFSVSDYASHPLGTQESDSFKPVMIPFVFFGRGLWDVSVVRV